MKPPDSNVTSYAATAQRIQRPDDALGRHLGAASALRLAVGGVRPDQGEALGGEPERQQATVVLEQHHRGDFGSADQLPGRVVGVVRPSV